VRALTRIAIVTNDTATRTQTVEERQPDAAQRPLSPLNSAIAHVEIRFSDISSRTSRRMFSAMNLARAPARLPHASFRCLWP
jgi:hypothetical protein